MLRVLLESDRPAPRRGRSTAASALAHLALVGTAIALTTRAGKPVPDPIRGDRVVYVAPQAPASRTQPFRGIADVAALLPHLVPRVVVPTIPSFDPFAALEHQRFASLALSGDSSQGLGNASAPAPGTGVHTIAQVDRPVVARADNPQPSFPSTLRNAGVEGNVCVRFVVDSAGRVEPRSIEILESTHALFGAAVRSWLPRTRYIPAQVGSVAVRQLVEQRVEFTLRQ